VGVRVRVGGVRVMCEVEGNWEGGEGGRRDERTVTDERESIRRGGYGGGDEFVHGVILTE